MNEEISDEPIWCGNGILSKMHLDPLQITITYEELEKAFNK